MKIFIDGDGCPVIDLTIDMAKKYDIEVVIVCDTAHELIRENVKTVVVSKGSDSTDFALVNMLQAKDIVITQDYGLAAMCLAKRAYPMNQNGMIYSNENIDSLLLSRYTAKKVRLAGGRLKGPKKRVQSQNQDFTTSLQALILKLIQ